jgi:hypothetical protein
MSGCGATWTMVGSAHTHTCSDCSHALMHSDGVIRWDGAGRVEAA